MATSYTSPFTGDLIVPTDVSYNSLNLTQPVSTLIWSDSAPRRSDSNDVFFTARIMDLVSTTNGNVLKLPDASEGSVGTDMLFRNIGSSSIVIHDANDAPILTIAPGISQWFYLTNNQSSSGVWRSVTFGAGVSGANAGDLAGGGLRVDQNTELAVGFPVTRYTSPPILEDLSSGQTIDWVGTNDTILLPTPSEDSWLVLIRNNGTGELNITPPSGLDIDGLPSVTLLPDESTFIIYNKLNNGFVTIGRNRQRDLYFSISNWDITDTGAIINLSDYASIILSLSQSGDGQTTTVQLPAATNTYYIINNTQHAVSFQNGTDNPSAGNVIVVNPNEATTAVSDGTNVYATNAVAFGAITLANSSKQAPGVAIEEEGVKTTGFYAQVGEAGITVDNAVNDKGFIQVTQNGIELVPGIEGRIEAILDGGYIA